MQQCMLANKQNAYIQLICNLASPRKSLLHVSLLDSCLYTYLLFYNNIVVVVYKQMALYSQIFFLYYYSVEACVQVQSSSSLALLPSHTSQPNVLVQLLMARLPNPQLSQYKMWGTFHAASNEMQGWKCWPSLNTHAGGYMSGFTISDLVIYQNEELNW